MLSAQRGSGRDLEKKVIKNGISYQQCVFLDLKESGSAAPASNVNALGTHREPPQQWVPGSRGLLLKGVLWFSFVPAD